MIQERYGHNEMCYPSQSFGLTKIYMKGAFGKPCTSCKWGATHTLFAVHIIWVLATVRQVFVLSQVPLRPTQNHREQMKNSHRLRFSFQSVPLGIHLFSTYFLFCMVFARITSVFKDGLHSVRNIFLTKVPFSKHCSLDFRFLLFLTAISIPLQVIIYQK